MKENHESQVQCSFEYANLLHQDQFMKGTEATEKSVIKFDFMSTFNFFNSVKLIVKTWNHFLYKITGKI